MGIVKRLIIQLPGLLLSSLCYLSLILLLTGSSQFQLTVSISMYYSTNFIYYIAIYLVFMPMLKLPQTTSVALCGCFWGQERSYLATMKLLQDQVKANLLYGACFVI